MTLQELFEQNKRILELLQQKTNTTEREEPLLSDEMPIRSKEQHELFASLSKAQAEMPIATKGSTNPFFKSSYASFADIIKASRAVLSKHNLSISQSIIERENGQRYLYTVLTHASGQFIASRLKILPPKPDIQEFGKFVSYIKRYAYAALVGVADADEDDDGESIMKYDRKPEYESSRFKKEEHGIPLPSETTISRDQYDIIEGELKGYPHLLKLCLDAYKINTLADLPKQKFQQAMGAIKKNKQNLKINAS